MAKKILVNKGLRFLRGGAILLFGQIGLNLLLGYSNLLAPFFIYGGLIIMFIGFILYLGGEKEIRWHCSKCEREFIDKKECLNHERGCNK